MSTFLSRPISSGASRLRRRSVLVGSTVVAVLLAGCASTPSSDGGDGAGDNSGVVARIIKVGSPGTNYGFISPALVDAVAETGATAEETGYFPATEPALEALNAGAADFAEVVTSGALSALAGSGDFLFLGVNTIEPGASSTIVVPKDSSIKSVEDLEGHSVAVTKGAAGEYIVDMAMADRDMEPGSIEKVPLGPGDAAAAFTNGSVDAWAAFATFIPAALESMNARAIVDEDELEGKYDYGVLVVRRDFAEAHPEVTKAVLDGYTAAGEDTTEDPTDYLQAQQEANGFTQAQLDWLEETLGVYTPYTDETIADLQANIDAWFEVGTLGVKLDASELVFDYDAVGD